MQPVCNLINFKNKEMKRNCSELSSLHAHTAPGVCHPRPLRSTSVGRVCSGLGLAQQGHRVLLHGPARPARSVSLGSLTPPTHTRVGVGHVGVTTGPTVAAPTQSTSSVKQSRAGVRGVALESGGPG